MSIFISTIIYVLIMLRLTLLKPKWFIEIDLSEYSLIKTTGFILVSIGFIVGIFALIEIKNSWSVGIKYDQKTKLITTGIYGLSRNPLMSN